MNKIVLKGAALFLSSLIAFGAMSVGVSAASGEVAATGLQSVGESTYSRNAAPRVRKNEYSLARVSDKRVSSHRAVTLSYNGTPLGFYAREINSRVYLPMRAVLESLTGAKVSYNSAARTLTATGTGYNISVSDGAYALYSSGRVMFSETPSVILSDGRMYVPAESLLSAVSLSLRRVGGGIDVYGTAAPIMSGDRYYREDEVYWLSRIISAESRGESLIGQIAVGSVIMNRVRSSAFPNTIWGVIFDRKHGVQFSPVSNGTVYAAPTASAILAAKITLEGFRVSDEVLYFLAPSVQHSSWIESNREYAFSIGRHDFYK